MNRRDSFMDMLDSFPEGWRPTPGDKLVGVTIGLETRTTEYGDYPIVTLRTDEGRDFAFHAYHTVARRELEKLQPKVGDRIGIAYHGPHPTRNYERYRIVIARATGGDDESTSGDAGSRVPPQSPLDQPATTNDDDDDIPF